jgi:hypothetical protein
MAKAKLAPTKRMTIPRLELMASVITAKLMRYVQRELSLPDEGHSYWTDSMVALAWIKSNPNKWKQWVGNRVMYIQELSKPEMWHYCPTKENPADLPSRGMTFMDFNSSILWKHGPEWLKKDESFWPIQPKSYEEDSILANEKNKKIVSLLAKEASSDQLFNTEKFSKYIKILRITAWIQRFVSNIKAKTKTNSRKSGDLTYHEIMTAELYWFQQTQLHNFEEEYQLLCQKQPVMTKSPLYKLKPFIDDSAFHLIRVGGRLKHSTFSDELRHPIILPKKNDMVSKLVLLQHQQLLCAGPEQTIASLRHKVWIIQARHAVKSAILQCGICKRARAQPFSPTMAPLPNFRTMVNTPPFHTTGFDLAGPFNIKTTDGSQKVYIALFTCAVVRAVHLELLTSMDANQIIMAIKRFTGRRGPVSAIWSDNAKYFKAADKYLERLWRKVNHTYIQQRLIAKQIEWHYIPERGPHFGGFYERLFRSIKAPLKIALGQRLLNYEELYTILVNIEQILNSRPLTYLSEDPDTLDILTPAHFLVGRSLLDIPDDRVGIPQSAPNLIQLYKKRQTIMQMFWKRFIREYIPKLIPYTRWIQENNQPVQQGDIVLIHEANTPKAIWPYGRIIKLYTGKDGTVRVVDVKTQTGFLRRPVHRLYLMESQQEMSLPPIPNPPTNIPPLDHSRDGGRGPEEPNITPLILHGGRKTRNSAIGRK